MDTPTFEQSREAPGFTVTMSGQADVELAFLIDDAHLLKPYLPGLDARFSDALAQAVSAAPSDLARHTRRIFHAYEQIDGESLYGALLDLFLILGARGRPLRARLLNGTQARLAPDQLQALRLWLHNDAPMAAMPGSPASRLSDGVEGDTHLLTERHAVPAKARDALLEAWEYIEYSQLDQARDLLERAVLQEPDREDLHIELLALFRATGDHAGRLALRERLGTVLDELPACWRAEDETFCGDQK